MTRTEMGNDVLKEPDEVAAAVLDVMSSRTPKHRYMVVPNAEEARWTIEASMQRLLELNQNLKKRGLSFSHHPRLDISQ